MSCSEMLVLYHKLRAYHKDQALQINKPGTG